MKTGSSSNGSKVHLTHIRQGEIGVVEQALGENDIAQKRLKRRKVAKESEAKAAPVVKGLGGQED